MVAELVADTVAELIEGGMVVVAVAVTALELGVPSDEAQPGIVSGKK